MCSRLMLSSIVIGCIASSTALAQDNKSESTIDANTLQAGEYIGKLVAAPAGDGLFSLRMEYFEAKDPAAARRASEQMSALVQQARSLEQQVAANPTPQRVNSLQQAYNKIKNEQGKQRDLYKISYKEIEFHAADNMIVRFLLPPVIYDEKGERKKFTQLDLQEMHGDDPTVPGFAAKLSDLQTNQVLRVSLRPAKPAPANTDKSKPAPKMEAAMAVIVVAEDTSPVPQDPADQPKKKKRGK
jgi:hypothetical protein